MENFPRAEASKFFANALRADDGFEIASWHLANFSLLNSYVLEPSLVKNSAMNTSDFLLDLDVDFVWLNFASLFPCQENNAA